MNISLNDNRTVTYGQTIENKPASGAEEVKPAANGETSQSIISETEHTANPQRASLVENVLIAAGVVSNESSRQIVEFLIGRQMPVDRDSVRKLVTENKAYPKADLDMLCLMNRNHIPVNEASILGMEHFLNSETMLAEALDKVFEDIEHALDAEPGDPSEVMSEAVSAEAVSEFDGTVMADGEFGAVTAGEAGEYMPLNGEAVSEVPMDSSEAIAETAVFAENGAETVSSEDEGAGHTVGAEKAAEADEETAYGGKIDMEETGSDGRSGVTGHSEGRALTGSELRAGIKAYTMSDYRNAPYGGDRSSMAERARLTFRTTEDAGLKAATGENETAEPKESLREAVERLVNRDGFISETQESGAELVLKLREKLAMKPDEINRESIKKLYESISELLKKTSDASDVGGHSPLKAHALEAQKLLEFMRDASDIYPYVEIPVKLEDSRTEAGLYVYSKEKGKNIDPENCTALLHIDMPHLGLLDIRLGLSGRQLGMIFSADEEPMRFLESEIDELVDTLVKKDYTVTPKFEVRGESDSENAGDTRGTEASDEGSSEDKQTFDPGGKSFDVKA